jgi:hypothetical protein
MVVPTPAKSSRSTSPRLRDGKRRSAMCHELAKFDHPWFNKAHAGTAFNVRSIHCPDMDSVL